MATSRKIAGAAKGAASGAALGTAILPGWGTAIGALGGALIGGIGTAGKTEEQKLAEARLAELMRLQELGALGLSDEEMALAQSRILSPIRGQQAEFQRNVIDRLSGGDIDAGSMAKLAMSREDAQRRALAEGQRLIAEADYAAKAQQKAEMQALELGIAQETDASRAAALEGVLGFMSQGVAPAIPAIQERNLLLEELRAAEAAGDYSNQIHREALEESEEYYPAV